MLKLLTVWVVLLGYQPATSAETVDALASRLPPAADFVADARQAARNGIPILVVVTRDDCGYCLKVKQEIVIPMQRSGDYQDRLIMRELNVDWLAQVTDFRGQRLSTQAWADQYQASFTPTVMLLDPGGQEVADRMVGINTVEMYGWYLDQAILSATQKIKGQTDKKGVR